MKHLFAAILFILSIPAGCSLQSHQQYPDSRLHPVNYKTKIVIILVLDGERYSETWGDAAHTLVPHLAGDLAPQGVVLVNYRNMGPTLTVPGHTALVSGFYQTMTNDGKTLPGRPVIFQLYRKLFNAPAADCWVVAGKDKLWVLSDSSAFGWRYRFTASMDCGVDGLGGGGYRDDAATFANLLDHLNKTPPRLMIINLKDPDQTAHAGDWDAYRAAILACDDYAFQLWTFLQNDARYKDQTALFITNDHGRHHDGVSSGFTGHGDDCDGCRHIMLCALGPDFRKGEIDQTERQPIDVTVTGAELLGFDIPGSEGTVMTELFNPMN